MKNKVIKSEIKDLKQFNGELTNEVVNAVLGIIHDKLIDDSEDDILSFTNDVIPRLEYFMNSDNWRAQLGNNFEDNTKCSDALDVVKDCYYTLESEVEELEIDIENGQDAFKDNINAFTEYAYHLEKYGTQSQKDSFIERIASVNFDNIECLPTSD